MHDMVEFGNPHAVLMLELHEVSMAATQLNFYQEPLTVFLILGNIIAQ